MPEREIEMNLNTNNKEDIGAVPKERDPNATNNKTKRCE